MIVFAANVGERDLYYNVGSANQPKFCHFELGKNDEGQVAEYLGCQHGARHIAEAILDRLRKTPDEEIGRLRYPILKTVLDEGILKGGRILDQLFLVVTDQPSSTAEKFRCRDTLNTGEVLKELIQRDYQRRIRAVRVIRYPEDLSNREKSYEFLGGLLPKIAPEPQTGAFHASVSGGVPALNDSLQDQALRLYKSKCHLYGVIPPDEQDSQAGADKGSLQPVSAKPFLKDLAVSIIEQLLARYDYSGALEVLKVFKPVRFWGDEVEAALRHAQFRLNLNFSEAAGVLKGYKQDQPFQDWWRTANEPVFLDRIIEAYFIAKSRYQNNEYADMLWRVRSIHEIGKKLVDGMWAVGIKQSNTTAQRNSASSLLSYLLGLVNLSNLMLHELGGVGLGDVNNAFSPPESIRKKYPDHQANHEFIVPTLKEITLLLSSLVGRKEPLSDPYQTINEYLLEKLRG